MVIPNYEILEKLADTRTVAVYKVSAKKEPDRLLVLKILKGRFSAARTAAICLPPA